MKKILLIFLILILLLLPSCGSRKEAVVSSEGTMLYLTPEEVGQYELSGKEGFFVLNEDGTFTPLASTLTGFSGIAREENSTRYLWFTNAKYDHEALIPKVGKTNSLVIIGNSSAVMPATVTLERYEYKGVTLGLHFFTDSSERMYLVPSDPLYASDAAKITSYSSEKYYEILSVNGSEELPLANVDNNLEMLLGLDEGKYYIFDFYKGTKYQTVSITADTKVFQASSLIVLDNPYRHTKNGYFYIELPQNLEAGYYYVNAAGLIYYEGGE